MAHGWVTNFRRLQFGAAYGEGDLVFARADGRFLDADSVSGVFERLNRASGLPRIRLQDLRHSHATILLMAGEPVHVVSQRLGHPSPMITLKTYAHVVPSEGHSGLIPSRWPPTPNRFVVC